MATAADASNLPDFLKPFHNRACLAEERLAKLEAFLKSSAVGHAGTSPVNNKELLDSLLELREKLGKVEAERAAEREQAQKEREKLATENAKLQYRIIHLVKALKDADESLEKASSPNM